MKSKIPVLQQTAPAKLIPGNVLRNKTGGRGENQARKRRSSLDNGSLTENMNFGDHLDRFTPANSRAEQPFENLSNTLPNRQ